MFKIEKVIDPDYEEDEEILNVLNKLDLKLFPDIPPYPKEGRYWWLAFSGVFPVGFSGLEIIEENWGFLCRTGVLSQYRGNGLQKEFISIREKLAKKIGLVKLITYASSDNYASMNSLISCGYKICAPFDCLETYEFINFYKNLTY